MRVLIAHNAYQFIGGEDTAVDAEIALLRDYGHEVQVYRRHNNELKSMPKVMAAASAIWSIRSAREMERMIDLFKPDVIHAHNTFPLISPSIFWVASRKNIPVLQTLHNFRLLCPQAIFLRNGHICEDCLGKMPWRAIPNKCYRDSVMESGVVAAMTGAHRMLGTYRNRITHFIVPSAFCRDKFVAAGMPSRHFSIKPNIVLSQKNPVWEKRKGGLFIGRLAPEKGLYLLMAALIRLKDTSIQVIGSGPLESLVKSSFGKDYLGALSHDRTISLLHDVQFLVAPSISYETFGMAVVEAFACGTPVIASRHGAFAELVKDGITGLLFKPGNVDDLADKIAWAKSHPEEMLEMGRSARAEFESKYTPQLNYQILIEIYENAINTVHTQYKTAPNAVGTRRFD